MEWSSVEGGGGGGGRGKGEWGFGKLCWGWHGWERREFGVANVMSRVKVS
jgi:hypothetical protein